MATTPEPTDQSLVGIASDSRQIFRILVIWMIGFVDSPIELQAAMLCVKKEVLNAARFSRSTMLEMSNSSYTI